MLAKKKDVEGCLTFLKQTSAAGGGSGGSSNADNVATAVFCRLERVRLLAQKRNVEHSLAFIEREYAAVLGRVIAAKLAPVDREAKRVKRAVAGKSEAGARDGTDDEGVDEATNDEGSEGWAGIA